MESKGYTVAVFNRTISRVNEFMAGRGKGKNFIGIQSIEEFVASIERPRKITLCELWFFRR
ncbi:MAG: NAD(P)-binding domain-containing protein [Mangrovibacterium sp.]